MYDAELFLRPHPLHHNHGCLSETHFTVIYLLHTHQTVLVSIYLFIYMLPYFIMYYLFIYVFICLFISFLVYYLLTYLSMFTSGDLLSLPHSFAAQPLTPSFVRFETPTLTPQTEVKALPLWLAFLCCTAQSELHNSHEPRTLPKLGMEFCS